jgi:hypothetical protein
VRSTGVIQAVGNNSSNYSWQPEKTPFSDLTGHDQQANVVMVYKEQPMYIVLVCMLGIGRTYKSGITWSNLPNTQSDTRLIPAKTQPWAQYRQPNRDSQAGHRALSVSEGCEFMVSAPLNFMPQEEFLSPTICTPIEHWFIWKRWRNENPPK